MKLLSISINDLHNQLKNYGNDFKKTKKEIITNLKIMNYEHLHDYELIKSRIKENNNKTNAILQETFYKYFELMSQIINKKDTIIIDKKANSFSDKKFMRKSSPDKDNVNIGSSHQSFRNKDDKRADNLLEGNQNFTNVPSVKNFKDTKMDENNKIGKPDQENINNDGNIIISTLKTSTDTKKEENNKFDTKPDEIKVINNSNVIEPVK